MLKFITTSALGAIVALSCSYASADDARTPVQTGSYRQAVAADGSVTTGTPAQFASRPYYRRYYRPYSNYYRPYSNYGYRYSYPYYRNYGYYGNSYYGNRYYGGPSYYRYGARPGAGIYLRF